MSDLLDRAPGSRPRAGEDPVRALQPVGAVFGVGVYAVFCMVLALIVLGAVAALIF